MTPFAFKLISTLFFMLVCTTQGCISDGDPDGPSLGAGDMLPQFSVELNNGRVVSTSTLKGKVAVIVFFNTGCPDCQKELPVIQNLWELYQNDETVEIFAIAREESATEISKYWKENNLTVPWSAQENRNIYNLFASSIIPRIYIADPSGLITASYDDSDMPDVEVLVNAIDDASKK